MDLGKIQEYLDSDEAKKSTEEYIQKLAKMEIYKPRLKKGKVLLIIY